MVILNHRYLNSDSMYSWLFIDPSEHHYTSQTSQFNNLNWASTMLDNVFNWHGVPNSLDSPYATIILLVSLKSRMPLGDETSNCSLWDLFWTSSAISLRTGVVTDGSWYHNSIALSNTGVYAGYLFIRWLRKLWDRHALDSEFKYLSLHFPHSS